MRVLVLSASEVNTNLVFVNIRLVKFCVTKNYFLRKTVL